VPAETPVWSTPVDRATGVPIGRTRSDGDVLCTFDWSPRRDPDGEVESPAAVLPMGMDEMRRRLVALEERMARLEQRPVGEGAV
jgi:hypothetical protein